ncbi:hypothetical protein C0J52_21125 [Blattella germanica]|nr:hypothetical protein C0J52_21125 [Blattella germanica]
MTCKKYPRPSAGTEGNTNIAAFKPRLDFPLEESSFIIWTGESGESSLQSFARSFGGCRGESGVDEMKEADLEDLQRMPPILACGQCPDILYSESPYLCTAGLAPVHTGRLNPEKSLESATLLKSNMITTTSSVIPLVTVTLIPAEGGKTLPSITWPFSAYNSTAILTQSLAPANDPRGGLNNNDPALKI